MVGKPTAKQRKGAVNSAIGLNSDGEPDPTKNVIALNEASVYRQDDLREAFEKYVNTRLDCIREVANLRAEHSREMASGEAKRLDAVRTVDVIAVKTESERARMEIQTLAVQAATKEETLRSSLTTTATAIAKQQSDIVGQLIERIAALEKSSYEGKGKEAVSDPMLAKMVTAIESLRTDMTRSTGKGEGMDKMWTIIMGIVGAGGGGLLVFLGTYLSK